jgi:hypothetical protein
VAEREEPEGTIELLLSELAILAIEVEKADYWADPVSIVTYAFAYVRVGYSISKVLGSKDALKAGAAGGRAAFRSCGDKLRGREGLLQKDAVRYAVRCPLVPGPAGDVDDGTFGLDLPDLLCDFPAAQVSLQANISHERPVVFHPTPEQGQGFFARRQAFSFKAAFDQSLLDNALRFVFVLDDKDDRYLRQDYPVSTPRLIGNLTIVGSFGRWRGTWGIHEAKTAFAVSWSGSRLEKARKGEERAAVILFASPTITEPEAAIPARSVFGDRDMLSGSATVRL